jgi:Cytochrome c554 and c-prime
MELRVLWRATALSVTVAVTLLLMYLQRSHATAAHEAATRHRPTAQPAGGYVASVECRACHPEQYASWRASYHSTMTQAATPGSVRGDFSGTVLQHGSERVQLTRQGDQFAMQVLPPVAGVQTVNPLPLGQYPVSIVTGSHHMQVYWYETGRGRELGQLPFAYLHEDARWVPRSMLFLRPPDRFRAGETGRWNASCLHCHATRAQPRLDPSGNHDTLVVELGIACEACHGPAHEHVARYSSPVQRYASHLSAGAGTQHAIVHPGRLTAGRASEICSQCHAIWQPRKEHAASRYQTGLAYRPGDDPEQTMWLFAPSRIGEDERIRKALSQDRDYARGQFWSDGQARISGREYNGMIESPCMKSAELSCLSCHDMHRKPADARPVSEWANDQLAADKGNEHGDAACLSCHNELEQSGLTAHTRHDASSPGSRCYNCHMPHTSWGLLKGMRTHRIGSPSVQETLQTGRPNACTLCHLDQSLSWTARMLSGRFGVESPSADLLAAKEHSLAAGVALALLGDAGQRALIAAAMGRPETQRTAGQVWLPAVLGVLMDDPYDAVRYAAGRSLRSLEGFDGLEYDFVPRPDSRAAIAGEIARRAATRVVEAAQAGGLSSALPLTSDGVLSEELTRELLSRRDTAPVHLLE